jgi:ABC-type nickel/cobalt efflux system permease component RcnA
MVGLFFVPPSATAHPVPRGDHDRTIVVRLIPDGLNNRITVDVAYRLEVDELTVLLDDMLPFQDQIKRHPKTNKPLDIYADFTRVVGPVLARHLMATADGEPLALQCERQSYRKTDDAGTPLGHLRCDFVFRVSFPVDMAVQHAFDFKENNYERRPGQIKLAFLPATSEPASTAKMEILHLTVPDVALQARPAHDLRPGDDAQLRHLAILYRCLSASTVDEGVPATSTAAKGPARTGTGDHSDHGGLLDLFLHSDHGSAVLLLLAALIGAAHALTPGHGKTLVAAYLVGQRGTVGHALILGIITTITHTGVVLLIAAGLLFVPDTDRQLLANTLGLAMGLALFCLGIWLLLKRLAGQADHFHLPGDKSHQPDAVRGGVGLGGLVLMGVSGGIVPCWDAVAMLGLAIGMNLVWFALPMLLAFSAGLASVLVLIGILVVHARKMLDARWSNSRLIRVLPIISALFITAMGVLVCMQGVHNQ